MSEALRKDIKPVLDLTNDNFLAAFNISLKLLEKKKLGKEKQLLYYTVEPQKDDIKTSAEVLCNLLESIIQDNTSREELESTFVHSGLQKERINLLVSQLDQLKELIAKRKLYGNTREELIDLQWKFGVVAGSSVKEEAGRTFVQVKLVSRSSDGCTSSRHLEMSLEKFYDFLHQLEKAKASLEYFSYL